MEISISIQFCSKLRTKVASDQNRPRSFVVTHFSLQLTVWYPCRHSNSPIFPKTKWHSNFPAIYRTDMPFIRRINSFYNCFTGSQHISKGIRIVGVFPLVPVQAAWALTSPHLASFMTHHSLKTALNSILSTFCLPLWKNNLFAYFYKSSNPWNFSANLVLSRSLSVDMLCKQVQWKD